jgi:hypothetical protein
VDKKSLYKIHFLSRGSVYELYAEHISQSNLFGFIEIGKLIFGKAGSVVVDPSEERLRNEFSDVKRFYVPLHSVLRIDEVEKKGVAKIVDFKEVPGTISPFPIYTSPKK